MMEKSITETLKIGDTLPYDIILASGCLSFKKGTPVTEEILKILHSGNITQIKIDAPVKEKFEEPPFHKESPSTSAGQRLQHAYMLKNVRSAICSLPQHSKDYFGSFENCLGSMWSGSSESFDISSLISTTESWVDSNEKSITDLVSIGWKNKEECFIPIHMIDVAKLASIIASEIVMDKESQRCLTIAGLVHDIGELYIDQVIISKRGKLESSEIKKLREHPRKSVEMLKRAGMNSEAVHRLILRHHERFNGSGYPYNITGKVLGVDDVILGFADVYTALISSRPYRQAHSRREAIKMILAGRDQLFAGNIVEKIARILGAYPPGSLVQLKSGGLALVLAPPTDGKWYALMIDTESAKPDIQKVDLNSLSGDYIVKEYA